MKNFFWTGVLLLFTLPIFAQNANWNIGLHFQRQISLNKSGEAMIMSSENGGIGIQQIGISLNREILRQGAFKLKAGLAYFREVTIPSITVNHCFKQEICTFNIVYKTGYAVDMIGIPLVGKFAINKFLSLNLNIIPQFRFHQNMTVEQVPVFKFDFNSLEIYPELEYQIGRFGIGCGYRILNMKKIDPIFSLYNSFLFRNPDYYDQSLEYRNPAKFMLSISYLL